MPRRPRYQTPEEPDFSPTEVADQNLLDIGRAAVYRQIQRGEIRTVRDEHGYVRITESEIQRLQQLRHIRPKKPQALSPAARELKHQIQVDSGREGGKTRAALHSKEEIAGWYQQGWRERQIARIDPHHQLPPHELERRLDDIRDAQLARARRAGTTRRLLRELQQQPHP